MPALSPNQGVAVDRIPPALWKRFKPHLKGKETPFLIVDLKTVARKYDELARLMPEVRIHYAVKANPAPEIIKILADRGGSFDIASIPELDRVLSLGVHPDRISYGNTIKKERDIAAAYERGVRIFACDSEEELLKQARAAKGSRVFFRLATDGLGADWPLSKKFGSHPDLLLDLAVKAKKLKLIPWGLSFHVGSQQRDIGQWDTAIAQSHILFTELRKLGIHLKMLNLGGGMPCNYIEPTRDIKTYTEEIQRYLKKHFGENLPELFIEPGRSLVGDAGMIASEVVLISKKSKADMIDWVYLDVGIFGGMIECLGEAIKYPCLTERKGRPRKVILAGPTCDSVDILYQNYHYTLPENLKTGDKVCFFTAGAYTTSYSSVEFNGFPPLKSYYI